MNSMQLDMQSSDGPQRVRCLNNSSNNIHNETPIPLTNIAVVVKGVTIKPALCPTNKIAPHRKLAYLEYNRRRREDSPRTFGAYFDLLAPNSLVNDQPINLEERPQDDDPNDCSEIEDYDENDLSSQTSQSQRRYLREMRFFFENPNRRPPAPYRPRPDRYPAQRPPTGGYFGGNSYRPPLEQHPSHNVKPVYEDIPEAPVTYKPGLLVGAPVHQIVGMTTNVPTEAPPVTVTRRPPNSYFFPSSSRPQYPNQYPMRPSRPRQINNDESIFGSFISLLLK